MDYTQYQTKIEFFILLSLGIINIMEYRTHQIKLSIEYILSKLNLLVPIKNILNELKRAGVNNVNLTVDGVDIKINSFDPEEFCDTMHSNYMHKYLYLFSINPTDIKNNKRIFNNTSPVINELLVSKCNTSREDLLKIINITVTSVDMIRRKLILRDTTKVDVVLRYEIINESDFQVICELTCYCKSIID